MNSATIDSLTRKFKVPYLNLPKVNKKPYIPFVFGSGRQPKSLSETAIKFEEVMEKRLKKIFKIVRKK